MAQVLLAVARPAGLRARLAPLESAGVQLLTAEGWEETRDVLLFERVAAVVVDRDLRGPQAEGLADLVRENLRPAPVLLVRADLPLPELRALAARVGAADYLLEGAEDERLRSAILRAVEAFDRSRAAESTPSTARRRVLVVDDSRTRREWLTDWFRDRGVHCEAAGDGAAALRTLRVRRREELPHLVVTDLRMPHLDGKALLRALDEDPELRHLPALLYTTSLVNATSYADGELEHVRDLSDGAMDFDELVGRLEAWLQADGAEPVRSCS